MLEQGDIRFVVSRRARRRLADRRPRAQATATACTTSPGSSTTPTPRYAAAVGRGAPRRARPVDRDRRPRRRCELGADRRRTARPCTRSSTAAATRGALLEPGYTTENLPTRPVGPTVGLHAHRPRRRQRRAGPARRLGALLQRRARLRRAVALRRRPDPHRVLGADVDGRVGRRRRSSCRSTSRPTACSKSQIQEYLEHLRRPGRAAHRAAHRRHRRDGRRRCATAACASCTCPTPTTTRPRERLAGFDLPWDDAAAAQHPRRPRPRRLPAADLHRDDHRPARRCSSRSSSGAAPRASARATSRRCSRRSSATRPAAATSSHAALPPRRRHPAQAPHAAPRRRRGRCAKS